MRKNKRNKLCLVKGILCMLLVTLIYSTSLAQMMRCRYTIPRLVLDMNIATMTHITSYSIYVGTIVVKSSATVDTLNALTNLYVQGIGVITELDVGTSIYTETIIISTNPFNPPNTGTTIKPFNIFSDDTRSAVFYTADGRLRIEFINSSGGSITLFPDAGGTPRMKLTGVSADTSYTLDKFAFGDTSVDTGFNYEFLGYVKFNDTCTFVTSILVGATVYAPVGRFTDIFVSTVRTTSTLITFTKDVYFQNFSLYGIGGIGGSGTPQQILFYDQIRMYGSGTGAPILDPTYIESYDGSDFYLKTIGNANDDMPSCRFIAEGGIVSYAKPSMWFYRPFTAGVNNDYNYLVIYSTGLTETTTSQYVVTISTRGALYTRGNITGDGTLEIEEQAIIDGIIIKSSNTSVIMGADVGQFITTGHGNVLIGENAGYSITTGHNNVFIGENCGYSNISGDVNVFIGEDAGYSNTTGDDNIFIGENSGYSNTSGYRNVFMGENSGWANTTGNQNNFIGFYAGSDNISGNSNCFSGRAAGSLNKTGSYNSFFGMSTGRGNTTGTSNSFFGSNAGYNNAGGNYNTFIGYRSGYYNANGHYNTFLGYRSGHSMTTGTGNVFLGYEAGFNETTGQNELYIENSDSTTPLIYGNFGNDKIWIHGDFAVGSNTPESTFYVDDGGDVGFNDSTPDAQLDIKSNRAPAGYIVSVSSQDDGTGNIFSIFGSGNTSFYYNLTVGATMQANTVRAYELLVSTIRGYSDIFVKNNIDMGTKNITNGGTAAFTTLNTGNGAYELFAMNQDVETSDNVEFLSVDTPQIKDTASITIDFDVDNNQSDRVFIIRHDASGNLFIITESSQIVTPCDITAVDLTLTDDLTVDSSATVKGKTWLGDDVNMTGNNIDDVNVLQVDTITANGEPHISLLSPTTHYGTAYFRGNDVKGVDNIDAQSFTTDGVALAEGNKGREYQWDAGAFTFPTVNFAELNKYEYAILESSYPVYWAEYNADSSTQSAFRKIRFEDEYDGGNIEFFIVHTCTYTIVAATHTVAWCVDISTVQHPFNSNIGWHENFFGVFYQPFAYGINVATCVVTTNLPTANKVYWMRFRNVPGADTRTGNANILTVGVKYDVN